MSRFSTISTQHSALRDLERQKLERKLGQLRREVEGSDQVCTKLGGQRDERRFKPPRRRQHAARCNSEAGHHSARGDENTSCRPGPGADIAGGERAQSVEIAWLWHASNRMEEDAEQVASFLTKHGLDRYGALLADDPSGIGASLEALVQADDSALEEAGVPASPRQRLLVALKAEAASLAAAAAAAAPASRPRSAASAPGDSLRPKPATPSSIPAASPSSGDRWGCLGRAPAGWHRVAQPDGLSSRVVQTSDAATGGDGCDEVCSAEPEEGAPVSTSAPPPQRQPTPPPPSAGPRRPTPQVQAQPSRPSSAASRPGSSHGSTERVSCYQCYKQVVPKFAVSREDAASEAGPRLFCGEACASRFQGDLEERRERERRLSELRASVLGGADAEVAR